ncbi:hypothetical protein BGZ63DRAFT_148653 [Mariannaea sp. PMI_226]|nr:hypothetical protein BGZ63DRAFT_148653 [Mariannaea sp. PMI_226]
MKARLALFVGLIFIHPIWCNETFKIPSVPDCALPCFKDLGSSSACSSNPACLCTNETLSQQALLCTQGACLPRDIFATINATMTSCNAPVRDVRQKYDVLTIALTVLATVTVALRLLERLLFRSGMFSDDYFIVLSTLVNIANSLTCIFGLSPNGLGKDSWAIPADQVTEFLRFLYVGSVFYSTTVFLVKICILLFFLRIFPGETIRKVTWVTIGLNAAALVIFNVVTLTQCRPTSYYWQRWDQLHEGNCNNINAMAWAGAVISIVMDFWMLALPVSQVVHLQVHWKKKVAAALMFGVGTFVTVVCILRLKALVKYGHTVNPTWDAYDTCYWSSIELNVAILCVCMPNIRLLLVRMFPRAMKSSHNRSTNVRNGLSASRGERINDEDPTGGRPDTRNKPGFQVTSDPKGSSSTIELVGLERPTSNRRDVV